MSLAHITLYGNLGRDPETRYTKSGAMNVSFSMAVSTRRGMDEHTDWYRVTAWGKLAELMDRFAQDGTLAKGTAVVVLGRLTTSEYTGKDGSQRFSLDVNADTVQLAGSRNGGAPRPSEATDIDDLPF